MIKSQSITNNTKVVATNYNKYIFDHKISSKTNMHISQTSSTIHHQSPQLSPPMQHHQELQFKSTTINNTFTKNPQHHHFHHLHQYLQQTDHGTISACLQPPQQTINRRHRCYHKLWLFHHLKQTNNIEAHRGQSSLQKSTPFLIHFPSNT